MSDAYKCDNCDVFHDGLPDATLEVDGNRCSVDPDPKVRQGRVQLCKDCWAEFIENTGLDVVGDE